MVARQERHPILGPATSSMILLDTNAVIWLHTQHSRSRALRRFAGRLYASPASVLELQLLIESGRLRFRANVDVVDFVKDERWVLDDPPSAGWFERSLTVSWTRDPFDRLLVAHAQMRGWRFATGDAMILKNCGPSSSLEL